MSTTKRALDTPLADPELAKRKGIKPGRKPLDTEAKNKRTAQNRAAQRAFRERKERKMKELEDKVEELERVRKDNESESDFLRSQLITLIEELKKYRPQQQAESQVLTYLAQREEERRRTHKDSRGGAGGSATSDSRSASESTASSGDMSRGPESSSSNSPSDNGNDSKVMRNVERKSNFTFEFPWRGPRGGVSPLDGGQASFPSPSASSATSSTWRSHKPSGLDNTPSSSSGSLDMFNAADSRMLPKFAPENLNNDFDFSAHFDEQVSEFCSKMNEVCGTRDRPIPASYAGFSKESAQKDDDDQQQIRDLTQPSALTNTWDSPQFGQINFNPDVDDANKWIFGDASASGVPTAVPSANVDEIPFIDPTIAFPSDYESNTFFRQQNLDNISHFFDDDPVISQLTTEDSNYDQFKPSLSGVANNTDSSISIDSTASMASLKSQKLMQSTQSSAETLQTERNYTINKGGDVPSGAGMSLKATYDAVVPLRDGNLLKCSEVWDRITAHPKYSDLDIDGLCSELRTKAKCSEKGVVVNADDVQKALSKHMA
ncbi:LAMI_0D11562g1_1 [Lachancea mirantina]|uniref:LAMI_0D11562g1_1 n=1 Tax=Lachancea mirantina TaxID=1230905 RepID=A0A1G4JF02_9SACH|nr:LAMI_0D11562g1_1 [Lachancea mirantina]